MYKIVKNINGELYSFYHNDLGEYSIKYIPGEWVYPKIGLIFIFIDLDSAKRFIMNNGNNEEIWECDYVANEFANEMSDCVLPKYIQDFWDNRLHPQFICPVIRNTLLCDSIKLKEKYGT